jgi:triacylglycerol lipase
MKHREPIVLVHGLFGFDEIKPTGTLGLAYFRNIAKFLSEAGYCVPDPPRLRPAGTVVNRARDLKDYLDDREETRHAKAHLIAHSMGGLDARCLISELDMAGRIASLTTIGTPHEGSPLADWIALASRPLDPLLGSLVRLLGFDPDRLGGIGDLTIQARADYNARVPDHPGVRYYTVAGRYAPERILGYPLGPLGLTCDLIQRQEGDNDGLVSVASALFQSRREAWTPLGTWDANHFRLINWPTLLVGPEREWGDRSIQENYLEIVRTVAGA